MKCYFVATFTSFAIEVAPTHTLQSVFGNALVMSQNHIYSPYTTFADIEQDAILKPMLPVNGGMQLLVRLINSKIITIDVPTTHITVSELKQLIFQKEGIKVEAQILYYTAKQMQNSQSLDEYGMQEGDIVHLIIDNIVQSPENSSVSSLQMEQSITAGNSEFPSTPFQVMVQGPQSENITVGLPERENTKVLALKQILRSKSSAFPSEFSIFYQGKLMEDEKSLKDYNVLNSSVLTVIIKNK